MGTNCVHNSRWFAFNALFSVALRIITVAEAT